MAHSFQEPAGEDLMPTADTLDIITLDTSHGPITHLVSIETGDRLRIPTDVLPSLAEMLLAEWRGVECDCDECTEDEEDDDE